MLLSVLNASRNDIKHLNFYVKTKIQLNSNTLRAGLRSKCEWLNFILQLMWSRLLNTLKDLLKTTTYISYIVIKPFKITKPIVNSTLLLSSKIGL